MTIQELSKLYNTRQRIAELRELILTIEARAVKMTPGGDGTPHGGGISDKTAIGAELADVRAQLERQEAQELLELAVLVRYIATVEDAFIGKLLRLRFVEGRTWRDVARKAGGGNTEDSVRKAVFRWLDKGSCPSVSGENFL